MLDRWLPSLLPESAPVAEEVAGPQHETVGPALPPFLKEIHDNCGEQAAAKILDVFLSSTPDLLNTLDDAVTNRNALTLRRAAHKLKGACAMIGTAEIASDCSSLETAAKQEDWSAASQHLAMLQNFWSEFEKDLRQAMSSVRKD